MAKHPKRLPIVSRKIPTATFEQVFHRNEKEGGIVETDPVLVLIEEMSEVRKYLMALTKARRWWFREMRRRDFEPWTKFWFGAQIRVDIVLQLMDDIYEAQYTSLDDLIHELDHPATTVRKNLSEAEKWGLISRARDEEDHRRILIRPTRRTMISYENHAILQQAMEFALRIEYGADNHRRYFFEAWEKSNGFRRQLIDAAGGYDTIGADVSLQNMNLVFDEEFYPRFIQKHGTKLSAQISN